ncbi:hypothetical protein PoB_000695400 [Plakobranchus ocellatus]|uniref:Uncharacterized protein n=1 Tax=Plakobranchus ocellatus TaxID=259542 RepID=A0AAV3YDW1_9GAST|nr:hypothetical protein PoB_000695400 [Plakobranchus ocellatus]
MHCPRDVGEDRSPSSSDSNEDLHHNFRQGLDYTKEGGNVNNTKIFDYTRSLHSIEIGNITDGGVGYAGAEDGKVGHAEPDDRGMDHTVSENIVVDHQKHRMVEWIMQSQRMVEWVTYKQRKVECITQKKNSGVISQS